MKVQVQVLKYFLENNEKKYNKISYSKESSKRKVLNQMAKYKAETHPTKK